ncbi:MAG: hypothetical protein Q9228_003867 [Teloschistes exilis]
MRSFNITALIGAAALAIRGVSGVALPVPDVNVAKPDALAEPNTLRTFLQSRATPNCVWQYNDISGGTCPQQIRDLNIGTLPRLLEECYHYTCTCKRDVNQIEASAQASADLAKREPIDGEPTHPPTPILITYKIVSLVAKEEREYHYEDKLIKQCIVPVANPHFTWMSWCRWKFSGFAGHFRYHHASDCHTASDWVEYAADIVFESIFDGIMDSILET